MTRLRDLSIKWKLTVLLLGSTLTVLLLACIALVAREVAAFRHNMVQELIVLADVVGDNSRGAISFDNREDAEKTLSSLEAEAHVMGARLYDKKAARFAEYVRKEATPVFPASPPADGYYFERDDLILVHPVMMNKDERIGTIYIVSDLQQINEQLKSYAVIICVVVLAAFLVTFTLSFRLHRFISDPILRLAETARVVAGEEGLLCPRCQQRGNRRDRPADQRGEPHALGNRSRTSRNAAGKPVAGGSGAGDQRSQTIAGGANRPASWKP